MEYLIAVDMEGVHGVFGEPYNGSPFAIGVDTESYAKAVVAATQEVNVVVNALFEKGATRVLVWDNHAARDNLDFSKVDPRAEKLVLDRTKGRLTFLSDFNFAGIVFIGYHSRAGSVNGIMAHTYNGMDIQYMKINGKQIGEFDIDSFIASDYDVPSIFVASDDVCVGQILEHSPKTVTVVTKIGKGRRKGIPREESEVLKEIDAGVREAVEREIEPIKLAFPCSFEIRYSSMDFAEYKMEELSKKFPDLHYGEDAYTLQITLRSVDDLRPFL